ncbi:tRNA (adenosine(37)-N6)-threonylcarbamoyltransferase complex ATPase subunit type 1 TsaE [Aquisalimonas asiatica]|uniref:tRNA threonylcarbamoyladenosine biosynthesis protein TsaE n=1 Tax=Aquisalimonas asiatica TaxID=406100 RepID=A0A1H8R090_9GAMM|nr:tRNA (adenosine(37)-N6)-threonylcarbamoyltransferase complex ATPase subunit type 1 TsaE [Aquisalimonas asiatica]SEO59667.1 tRNA threonylcarbamoyladenosine biosynthesis protein TsaE [Aquisalimonas asiatica]
MTAPVVTDETTGEGTVWLPEEAATARFGARLWRVWGGEQQCVILLEGDLGAGKTTLVRGLLREAGERGSVRSPTYTLIEPYTLGARRALHLDLYRLGDPEELEFLGLRDELGAGTLVLVEWPQRGHGALPGEDLVVNLAHAGDGRQAGVSARSMQGAAMLRELAGGS